MTRFKFLAFALIALGLWVAHLFVLSPLIATRASDGASRQLAGAGPALALKLETQRSLLQGALLQAATTPAVLQAAPRSAKAEAPTAEKVNQVRAAVQELVPEAMREELIVGVVNDSGALFAAGTKDPAAPPDGFDAHAAAASGGKGEVLEWGGPAIFHSVPIFYPAGAEVKSQGAVVLGLPLAPQTQKLCDEVTKELGLAGVGLTVGGKLTASSSGSKAALTDALKALKAGEVGPVSSGTVLALGPLKLPIATGGAPTLELGARRDIPGTPYEVVALASTKPLIEALAGYQKTALMMLAGLLLAALGFTVVMGGGGASEEDEDEERPVQRKAPAPEPRRREEPLPALLSEQPPPPEAHPDDFDFGTAPAPSNTVTGEAAVTDENGASAPPVATSQAPAYQPQEEPQEDPFAQLMAAPPSSASATVRAAKVTTPIPSRPPPSQEGDFDDARTVAYPAHRPPGGSVSGSPDPFALASAGEPQAAIGDDQPDATRVAAIPAELLKASARTTSGETTAVGGPKLTAPLPMVKPVAPAIPASGGSEEAHFRDVFNEFVATRDRCGEPADGLTYDKFAAKLRKNKDQLVAKYNCRTVRFQVYVKDGKAALKATPVKD